ncbi:hypothetical protein CYJ76_08110 [Kytococcus schroeteri]|uniref:Uncharacterized protein n=1 Tax=Kytococcus schroeteri TaxID=138300 RepID=A0A2I1P9S3_9MICO|nr:hypothetical protein CYJ76_08110 [Kytococcus schroeteri]
MPSATMSRRLFLLGLAPGLALASHTAHATSTPIAKLATSSGSTPATLDDFLLDLALRADDRSPLPKEGPQ